MRLPRIALPLTVLNVGLLAAVLSGRFAPGAADASATVVRASLVELVDETGVVRSRLGVERDGEVVLRLFDEDGTIRVKLGARRDGSGLVLLDEATEPAVHAVARRAPSARRAATTSLTLAGAEDRRRTITP
jgi:hypothetical protein